MEHLPVLIVGGGPSGLVMACELARYGVPFRIIDKKPEQTLTSNAAGIQALTLELFDHMGLLEQFLQQGSKCQSIVISINHVLATIYLDHLDSLYQYILLLPQADTERILNQHLLEYAYHVERSLELISIAQQDDVIRVVIKSANGDTETVTCHWLIACDGAHSTVRDASGVNFIGENINEPFVVADVTLQSSLTQNAIHIFSEAGYVLAVFPFGHAHYRIAANSHLHDLQAINAMMSSRSLGQYTLESMDWLSPFWIHSKMVDRFRVGRTFFVGDAAHIHSPLGGQGMNTGIQDAYNLAWKIAYVFKGYANVALLNSYQAERLPVVRSIVNHTERMTKVMISKNKFMQLIKKLLLLFLRNKRFFLDKITMRLSQLSIHYSRSPVICYQGSSGCRIQPGSRAPDVMINHTQRLHDYFKQTKHVILLFSGDATSADVLQLKLWIEERYAVLADCYLVIKNSTISMPHMIDDADGKVHQRYGIKREGIYVIRPDHYVGACSQKMSNSLIIDYMRGVGAQHA